MELATIPDGGLVQATDFFVVSRAGAARRISGSRIVVNDAAGNPVLGGNPKLAAGRTLQSVNAKLIGGDGGANTVIYTGTSGLNVRNADDTASLLSITNGGAITAGGSLDVVGSIKQNGQQVFHAGNFNPSAYMPLMGGSFSGPVSLQDEGSTRYWIGTSGNFLIIGSTGGAFNSNLGLKLSSENSIIQFNGSNVWHADNLNAGNISNLIGFTPANKAGDTFSGAIKRDAGLFLDVNAGIFPFLNFDDNDYLRFDRTNNAYTFFTGGNQSLTIDANGAVNSRSTISQNGQPVFHSGNFNPTSKYDASNPAGYISGITGGMVNAALGYTPANAAGQAFGGAISAPTVTIAANFLLSMIGGNPVATFDAGDTISFDRAANKFFVSIGGQTVASIDAAGNIRARGDVIGNVVP